MSKICGECVFFPGCSRYEGKTHDSEEAETCRAYLAIDRETEEEHKTLSDVPAVEVKTSGRWEREVVFGIRVLRCSACGKLQSYGKTSYCPNCGAEMEEDVYPSSQVYQVRERKNEQDQGVYQVSTQGAVHGVDRE